MNSPRNPAYEVKFAGIKLNPVEGRCGVEGCTRSSTGLRGVCIMHYKRIIYQGRAERKNQSGGVKKHPLYSIWGSSKKRKVICEAWLDFKTFVAAVGERPTLEHELWRPNTQLPYGPENFEWKVPTNLTSTIKAGEVITFPLGGKTFPSGSKEYAEARKNKWLLGRYGITLRQYLGVLAYQGNGCAICKSAEAHPASAKKRNKTGKTGRVFSLAVDHNHRTGRLRGVLCHSCNQALGLMRDNPDLLRAAAAYLDCDLYAEQQKKG